MFESRKVYDKFIFTVRSDQIKVCCFKIRATGRSIIKIVVNLEWKLMRCYLIILKGTSVTISVKLNIGFLFDCIFYRVIRSWIQVLFVLSSFQLVAILFEMHLKGKKG